MTTLQALKIFKTEFEDLNIPQKDGSFKSLMCLEDVSLEIVKKMKPEVKKFVNAQKRKKIITVENMYIENLIKEKRKNINPFPEKKHLNFLCTKKPPTRGGR